MKKSLLLGAAVLAFGMTVSAQKVQNIPTTEPLQLSEADGWTAITIKTLPEDGSDPKPRTSANAKHDNIWQFDNMCHGDQAVFKLNNTQEACYVIRFKTATKNQGSHILFEMQDAAGDLEWSTQYDVYCNNDWNSKFESTMVFIEDPLTVGEKTLTLTFTNDAEGKTATVNCCEFEFEARGTDIETCSLYTAAECVNENPDGDVPGSILVSPAQNAYLTGTEITLTAQANTGFKFLRWEDSDGNIVSEEAKYVFTIEATTDLIALFEKIKMESDVPGYVNLNTRTTGFGNPETKAVSLDGEPYNEGEPTFYLSNYRKGQSEEFVLDVKKAGTYTISSPFSSKIGASDDMSSITFSIYDQASYVNDPEATPEWTDKLLGENEYNNWQKFTSHNFENVALSTGRKVLRLDFDGTKYTVNLLYILFNDGSISDGVNDIVLGGDEAPVKAYNLQGIEVEPTTKGLIILSNGTKRINK